MAPRRSYIERCIAAVTVAALGVGLCGCGDDGSKKECSDEKNQSACEDHGNDCIWFGDSCIDRPPLQQSCTAEGEFGFDNLTECNAQEGCEWTIDCAIDQKKLANSQEACLSIGGEFTQGVAAACQEACPQINVSAFDNEFARGSSFKASWNSLAPVNGELIRCEGYVLGNNNNRTYLLGDPAEETLSPDIPQCSNDGVPIPEEEMENLFPVMDLFDNCTVDRGFGDRGYDCDISTTAYECIPAKIPGTDDRETCSPIDGAVEFPQCSNSGGNPNGCIFEPGTTSSCDISNIPEDPCSGKNVSECDAMSTVCTYFDEGTCQGFY